MRFTAVQTAFYTPDGEGEVIPIYLCTSNYQWRLNHFFSISVRRCCFSNFSCQPLKQCSAMRWYRLVTLMNCRRFLPGRAISCVVQLIRECSRRLRPFIALYRPLSAVSPISQLSLEFVSSAFVSAPVRVRVRPSACRCRLMGRRMLVGAKSHNGDDFRVWSNPRQAAARLTMWLLFSHHVAPAVISLIAPARPSLNEGGFSAVRRLFCSEVRIPIMDQNG